MFDLVKSLVFILITFFLLNSVSASERKYNLGKVALKTEVAGWDIDIRPDGKGAPKGKGNAIKGEEIYAEACASCHGDFGEGIDRWPELVGGQNSLDTVIEASVPVEPVGLDDQIAQAQADGDWQTSSNLKADKLKDLLKK